MSDCELYVGQRVYNRHADLFGIITAIGPCTVWQAQPVVRREDAQAVRMMIPDLLPLKYLMIGQAFVKYEWPYDPAAEPEEVAMSRLQAASEIEWSTITGAYKIK